MTKTRKIAIVGIGPRGGYGLERLIVELVKENSLTNIHIALFEETRNFGNGQVYDLRQDASNWINITERILELHGRQAIKIDSLKIEAFPSYHEWACKEFNPGAEETPDTYPPRSQIGEFLSQRLQTLLGPLTQSGLTSLYQEHVKEVKWFNDGKMHIITDKNEHKEFDEILLTIGHQPTELSEQIVDWEKFSAHRENINLFKSPYPTNVYLNHENINEGSSIGIRGFGLAMIDVVRAIAQKFGKFVTYDEKTRFCEYKTDYDIKNLLVPFSNDGLPPVPKPLNARIDNWFRPSRKSISDFEKHLGNKLIQKEAQSPYFLIESFVPIAVQIFDALPHTNNTENYGTEEIENIIRQWLSDQKFEHPLIISKSQSTEKNMRDFVTMAIGEGAISLDFCIGQVWRHCQPSIYKSLSFNECSDKVFAEIIELDESTKRYSYGPPVESIQQLLALLEIGVLNLDFVNDPEIQLTDKGWQFNTREKSITTNLMIDSVLDAPKIKIVKSELVQCLLSNNIMQAVHDEFGIATDENGYLISDNVKRKIPIALLGRLAKGTIIGVDAILECFGSRPQEWAKQATKNHKEWLDRNLIEV